MVCLKYSSLEIIAVLAAFLIFKKAKFPDFGILGSYIISAFISATLINKNISPIIIPIIGLFSGGLVGALTSLLHYKIRVNALLSGICSLFFVFSICYVINPKGSFSFKDQIISSNETIILLFVFLYLIISAFIYLIELTNWGTMLRASSLANHSLTYLNINKDHKSIYYLVLGNALMGFNSSMKILVLGEAALNMTHNVLEELLVEMVIGLFILDILLYLIHKYIKRVSRILLHPSKIRLLDYFIPLFGTMIFQLIYNMGMTNIEKGYHLRAFVIVVLITLIFITKKYNLTRYSSLEFTGVNV